MTCFATTDFGGEDGGFRPKNKERKCGFCIDISLAATYDGGKKSFCPRDSI